MQAGQKLDRKYFTPVFDGASIDDINKETDDANLQDLDKPISTMGVQESVLINLQQLV